ncbi:MAG TPA: amino acid permease [Thermoanaerobaculia bacterium]|nr:amino acid permease [Thermoanaerobaculia bacterium]
MAHAELRRELGATSAVMITVGSVIGSGIFLKPLDIARSLPSPAWIFGAWVTIGVICFCGALAYAELGAMLPEAGGMYAFIRESWGRFPAFLYGWCLMLVISSGAVAALAVAFASSLATLVPLGANGQIAVAAAMILTLALVNHFGVRWGALLQNLSTTAKLLSLFGIVVAGFVMYRVVAGDIATRPDAAAVAAGELAPPGLLAGLIVASVAIFWAYEGWYSLPFNAAELKRPERDLPRGLILGMLILVVTYTAVNAAYLHVVPLDEMRVMSSEPEVPKTVIARAFGVGAGDWLAILICMSTLGAANPNLLSSPRCFYAMARDGVAFPALMRVHAVYGTPTVAIWAQALWSVALVIVLKTFRDITEYVVFASLIFYGLAVAAVYLLRRRRPDAPRPYRCFGYPLTPAIFIAAVAFVDLYTLIDPRMRINALYGLGILVLGAVVYFSTRLHQGGSSTRLDRAA